MEGELRHGNGPVNGAGSPLALWYHPHLRENFFSGNPASMRVIVKNGFVREVMYREAITKKVISIILK
jgi:hypothetical protein